MQNILSTLFIPFYANDEKKEKIIIIETRTQNVRIVWPDAIPL